MPAIISGRKYGAKRDLADYRDLFLPPRKRVAILPRKVDERSSAGPIKDQKDEGSCFVGETLIPLLNGHERSLKELAEGIEGEEFWVYGIDTNTKKHVPAKATARLTRKNQPVVRVELSKDRFVICTLDHRLLLRDGTYKIVSELQIGDRLMPFYRSKSRRDYEVLWDNSDSRYHQTHWLVATHFAKDPIKGKVIHHVDFDKWNNTPENLQPMIWEEHSALHSKLSENFKGWNGSEEQREHSRRVITQMHKENPGWHLEGCSIGGKTAWERARKDPELFSKMTLFPRTGWHSPDQNKRRSDTLIRKFAEPDEKKKISDGVHKFYLESPRADEVRDQLREIGNKLGGQRSLQLQAAKLGNEVLERFGTITPQNWESIRSLNTSRVKLHTAVRAYGSFSTLCEAAQNYNSRVVRIEEYGTADVYCLEVPGTRNFALSAGIFVHNCTGHAGSSSVEWQWRKYKKLYPILSPQNLYVNELIEEKSFPEDDGAEPRTICKILSTLGVCEEAVEPYGGKIVKPTDAQLANALNYKLGGYHRLQGLADVLSCLGDPTPWPVLVGITVYESFQEGNVATTGIVPMPDAKKEMVLGGHEILCLGYDMDSRMCICQNSWGVDWGDKGFFYLPFDYVGNPELCSDLWVIHVGYWV